MADANLRASLLGTLVGGFIGLAGTIGAVILTHEQAENAEDKRATGAARVLADNLRRGEDLMADSLTDCRYRLYSVPLTLPHDDLVLLAWRLQPDDWDTLARALSAIRIQVDRSKSRVRESDRLDRFDATQVKFVIGAIDRGRHALEDVSGVQPYSADSVREELARADRCLR